MATYCWKCPSCGETTTSPVRDPAPTCLHMDAPRVIADMATMRRDYSSEGVGIGAGVRVSRTGTVADQARLVLPTNADFKGPSDPEGTKGMREWHDTHVPAASSQRGIQVPGHIERRSF